MIKPCLDCTRKKKGCMCTLWSKWYNEQLDLGFPDEPILDTKPIKFKFNPPIFNERFDESQKDKPLLSYKGKSLRGKLREL